MNVQHHCFSFKICHAAFLLRMDFCADVQMLLVLQVKHLTLELCVQQKPTCFVAAGIGLLGVQHNMVFQNRRDYWVIYVQESEAVSDCFRRAQVELIRLWA